MRESPLQIPTALAISSSISGTSLLTSMPLLILAGSSAQLDIPINATRFSPEPMTEDYVTATKAITLLHITMIDKDITKTLIFPTFQREY